MRVYDEDGVRYTYYTYQHSMKDRFCKITYPDGTIQVMNNKNKILKHIMFHKKHIYYGNNMEPYFNFKDYYVTHFDTFRKNKLYTIPENKFNKLKISDLLNDQPKDNQDKLKISNLLNDQSSDKQDKLKISNILN